MADHDDRTRPVLEHVLQHPQRVEVEVVGRFVEQQDVGARPQRQHQLQATPLATRQQPDRGALGVGVEPEPFEEAGVLPVRLARGTGDGLVDAHGRVEVDAPLGERPEDDGRADGAGALGRRRVAGDHVEQRRLAGAVRPDDAEPLTRVEGEVDATEQPRPVAVAVADAVQLDRLVAEARRAERQVQLALARGPLRTALDDRRRRGDARLGLAGPRRRAPAQPLELGPGQVATDALLGDGALLALEPRREVRGVAALVHVAATAVELEDPRRHPVEHVAVVGHQHQRTAVLGQALLQPADGVDVEVVGRLVEDQHDVVARLARRADLDEGAGERHPLGLPARQRRGRVVEAPAEVEPVERRRGVPAAAGDVTDRRSAERCVLVEHDDPAAPSTADHAGLRLGDPGELAQQRRLAAAVQPDDGESITRRDRHRDVGEQRPPGAAGGQADGVEQDHRRQSSRRATPAG